MPTAKKLPSGSWRCLAYSHTDRVWDDKKQKYVDKRRYESFTSDDKTRRGKHEAEQAAAEFSLNRQKNVTKTRNYTLREALDKYLESSDAVLSGTTLQGYRKNQYDAYDHLMNTKLRDITSEQLQAAVNMDSKRPSKRSYKNPKPISPKTVKNTYGFIVAAIHRYYPQGVYEVRLPTVPQKVKELIPPEVILRIIKGTDIELPCLLAIWLSFSMSEIRGLRFDDIDGDYLSVDRVIVDIGCQPTVKESGKAIKRLRKHRIPKYIKILIDKRRSKASSDSKPLIPESGHSIYMKWSALLEKNDLPHMTFHDLRHENASIMHALNVPEKYAMERGGWKTDKVMKQVYTHTFSKEREAVDQKIDEYFESLIDSEESGIDMKKYKAWMTLFDRDDSDQSRKDFKLFIQHELQHYIKKVP